MRYLQLAVSGMAAYDLNIGQVEVSTQTEGRIIGTEALAGNVVELDYVGPAWMNRSDIPTDDVMEVRIPVTIPGKSDIDYSLISGSEKSDVIAEVISLAFN